MATPQFHTLRIKSVELQTADAICVGFEVPAALKDAYRFNQGQFLTLKALVDAQELRRSYSICVGTSQFEHHGELKVAIKRVAGGQFSNWANEHLRVGTSIDVMTPDGRFHAPLEASASKHYVAFAGGSGITPMLSIIQTTLEAETLSQFTLIYGNRSVASIMFLEELDGLKSRFPSRLQLIHVLSEEATEVDLLSGVLNQEKCEGLLKGFGLVERLDHCFICGPDPMMNAAEAALKALNIPANKVSIERFGVPLPSGATRAAPAKVVDSGPKAKLNLVVDGKTRVLDLPFEGASVLDVGLASGANLPYACKGGVCCTCRAKVLHGEVRMEKNYTLEDWEVKKGFVLTCQCRPVSDTVTISFDER